MGVLSIEALNKNLNQKMEIFQNELVQLGAVGMLIFGMGWFSKTMFKYLLDQAKQSYEEQKELETNFRDFLIQQSKEHIQVIRDNTLGFIKLRESDEKFINYLEQKLDIQMVLYNKMITYLDKLNSNGK